MEDTTAPEGSVDVKSVMEILLRDNPKEVERAMMIVRIKELEEQNAGLLALVTGATQDS